jgi:site-specific DNA-methyltransferase (adenine-specific)
MSGEEYGAWFATVVRALKPMLKPTGTIYVCSDWKTSIHIAPVLEREFKVRSRITWARDKGRGASRNWKNNSEDIWFCTVSDSYTFNVDAVKVKRRVIAPYREENGEPKGWSDESDGRFRLTFPSNIWTDLTVPFWSMPENTDHPTQKPEKLIARLILASSNKGDFVFDPFLGSGTTAVTAKKLDRRFLGIEIDHTYCCWALKRLRLAEEDAAIQGYADGVFMDRNSPVRRSRQRRSIQGSLLS